MALEGNSKALRFILQSMGRKQEENVKPVSGISRSSKLNRIIQARNRISIIQTDEE